jgi:hypothetical protein
MVALSVVAACVGFLLLVAILDRLQKKHTIVA